MQKLSYLQSERKKKEKKKKTEISLRFSFSLFVSLHPVRASKNLLKGLILRGNIVCISLPLQIFFLMFPTRNILPSMILPLSTTFFFMGFLLKKIECHTWFAFHLLFPLLFFFPGVSRGGSTRASAWSAKIQSRKKPLKSYRVMKFQVSNISKKKDSRK